MSGDSALTGLSGLSVPVWGTDDGGKFEPLNGAAEAWTRQSSWPSLERLLYALIKVPGRASGSYESEGKVHQILTLDADSGPLVMMRPIRDGERDGEVERRLAEIVHDLNAPLTSMRLRLGGLRQGAGDEGLKTQLLVVDAELARMQGIVRDAVALGRLSAHILNRCQVEVRPMLQEIEETLRPIADQKEITIETIAPGGEALIDRRWIERALMNLADNAIRHSPNSVTVTLEARRNTDRWAFLVRDRGRGISPEVLSGRRDPHFQELPGEKGLAGLGLTLVRRIAAAHGGDLEVTSEEGVGSVFKLTIPDDPH